MCEAVIPSSPNWYCASVSDCKGNLFCYSARCCILIFDVENRLQYRSCIIAHTDRVTGISLGEANCCFSIGDDCKVKYWNLLSGVLIAEHSGHQVTTVCKRHCNATRSYSLKHGFSRQWYI